MPQYFFPFTRFHKSHKNLILKELQVTKQILVRREGIVLFEFEMYHIQLEITLFMCPLTAHWRSVEMYKLLSFSKKWSKPCLFFAYFISLHKKNISQINDKRVDGVLGIRTRGGRMVGAVESTE